MADPVKMTPEDYRISERYFLGEAVLLGSLPDGLSVFGSQLLPLASRLLPLASRL